MPVEHIRITSYKDGTTVLNHPNSDRHEHRAPKHDVMTWMVHNTKGDEEGVTCVVRLEGLEHCVVSPPPQARALPGRVQKMWRTVVGEVGTTHKYDIYVNDVLKRDPYLVIEDPGGRDTPTILMIVAGLAVGIGTFFFIRSMLTDQRDRDAGSAPVRQRDDEDLPRRDL